MSTSYADTRPHVQIIHRSAISAVVLFGAAVILVFEALATADRPTRAVVWGGLAVATYAGGLLCLVGARHGAGLGLGVWRLGSWTLLWYGIIFGLATITFSQPQTGLLAEITLPSVLRALWLVAVAITAWALGYIVGPGKRIRLLISRGTGALSRRLTADVRSHATPWILCILGVAANMAAVATTGTFGYVGGTVASLTIATGYLQILNMLSLCGQLAVAAAALQVFRERLPGARITFTVIFLIEIASDLATGGMVQSIVTVLAAAIPFSAAYHRLPKTALAVSALIFLVVVIPFNSAYRIAVHGSVTLSAGQAVAEAPRILGHTATLHNMATALPSSVNLVLGRIELIQSPAIILQRTPAQIGFLSPVQLIEAPVLGVAPRAIWPGKPRDLTGYQFTQAYFGAPSTLYSWAAVTLVGDLYRHGGWIPVLVGMSLIGGVTRLLDDIIDVRSNPHTIFLVLLFFPTLVQGQTGWLPTVSSIPETVLLFLLTVHLTFGLRRSQRLAGCS